VHRHERPAILALLLSHPFSYLIHNRPVRAHMEQTGI
jgi:hypothetical protein